MQKFKGVIGGAGSPKHSQEYFWEMMCIKSLCFSVPGSCIPVLEILFKNCMSKATKKKANKISRKGIQFWVLVSSDKITIGGKGA